MTTRLIPNVIIVTGLFLLARVFYNAATGSLVAQLFTQSEESFWILNSCALGLKLPVPLHVISIGLILQRGRLSPRFAKAAWIAIVVSGCWLGGALAIKMLVL